LAGELTWTAAARLLALVSAKRDVASSEDEFEEEVASLISTSNYIDFIYSFINFIRPIH
jgi:hypothetical protein